MKSALEQQSEAYFEMVRVIDELNPGFRAKCKGGTFKDALVKELRRVYASAARKKSKSVKTRVVTAAKRLGKLFDDEG